MVLLTQNMARFQFPAETSTNLFVIPKQVRQEGAETDIYQILLAINNRPISSYFLGMNYDAKVMTFLEERLCKIGETRHINAPVNGTRNSYIYISEDKTWGVSAKLEQEICSITVLNTVPEEPGIILELDAFKRKNARGALKLLVHEYGELTFREITTKPVIINYPLNYGKGFDTHHQNICNLLQHNKTGLILLHGEPGTGKSTYIRSLVESVNRPFLYISQTTVSSVANPDFTKLLLEETSPVIVLEDAEQAVLAREVNNDRDVVAMLLNLTDGMLALALNCTIIVSFNTKRETIDQALLRKGRLKYEYVFQKLGVSDAETLMRSKGLTHVVTEPMSLADIYNIEENNNCQLNASSTIGFDS